MKRQRYFPSTVSARPEWFANYATQVNTHKAALGLVTAEADATIADARFLEYATGVWITAAREFGPASTAAIETLFDTPGGAPFVLPTFAAPGLPPASPPFPAVVAVPSGALQRVFAFVQAIKARPGYTPEIGLQMGIVGAEDTADNPVPTFTLKLEQGTGCQCVRVSFKKYGREGVAVYGKRGAGDWELLGIDMTSPYLDERPLLAAGVPEARQYRLRFYENAAPVGDYTEVQSVVVA